MNVKDFIKASINQIIDGVKEAQQSNPQYVNPPLIPSFNTDKHDKILLADDGELVHLVRFDIAVTVDSTTEIKGDAGLKIAGFGGAEIEKAIHDHDRSVSRLKFSVPIKLPKEK